MPNQGRTNETGGRNPVRGVLDQEVKFVKGVGEKRAAVLASEVGITKWGDMLEYYPYKYVDRSRVIPIAEIETGGVYVQIRARIVSFESPAAPGAKKRIVAHVTDGSGRWADIVWWNGGKYILNTYNTQTDYIIFGKPSFYGGRWQFSNPDIDKAGNLEISGRGVQPYYVTTDKMKKSGLTSRSIEGITRHLTERIREVGLPETLPAFMLSSLGLMGRVDAICGVHHPKTHQEADKARFRLKFEELFYVQLNILRYTTEHRRIYRGHVFPIVGEAFNEFYHNHLSFFLTNAQKKVMHEIRADLRSGRQMNRLLQGDVGSGKTLVALMTMLIAVGNGYQACIMAPTEILAEQHFSTIGKFLEGMNVRTGLLTGAVKGKKREKILAGLSAGEIDILVGTHAIIEDPVEFRNMGLVVIDEQHRFGVAQRAKMWTKSHTPPHVLVMTATPIPRTLAMTLYGDLDVSVINELPPGRKPVNTLHFSDDRTVSLFDRVRREMAAGRQAYVVYPLIKESERIDLKNLEMGYATMCEAFPEFTVGKVHGRMKSAEKEAEMEKFKSGQTRMLVSTTVIEVGVDVPNASVMVIFDAQRFGLSQLHQLRGRVGRGADLSWCLLVTPASLARESSKRVDIMCSTTDGFEIAEADLKLRGPGDLEGTQQSGMAFDLKISNLATDGPIVEMARKEAQKVIDEDPECSLPKYSVLWKRMNDLRKDKLDWSAIS